MPHGLIFIGMVSTLAEAHQLILAQQAQLQALQEQVVTLVTALKAAQATLAKQQYQLNQYVERLYGRRSERHDPNQLCFDALLLQTLPDPDTAAAAAAGNTDVGQDEDSRALPAPPRSRKHTPHGRLPIPDHLEREIIELDVPEAERVCPRTGEPLVRIGYDDTEKLEYTPSRAKVVVYRRWKYAAQDRSRGHEVGVIMAPMPDEPIPKSKAAPGLIAYAIVSKFCDHLPFYRQQDIFAREGVHIPRSTLDGWALQTGDAIALLGVELKRAVLDTDVIFTDDSVIPLLEKGRGRTRQARLWVYVRGGTGPPLVAYDFTTDHRKKRPLEYLDGYHGYVHADAYSGYDELFRRPGLIEVGCWCHARRGFDEVMGLRPQEASEIIALIARMYRFEKQFRSLSALQRHGQRQDTVRPIVDTLFTRVEQIRQDTVPSEPLRKACDYVLNQRQALLCFLEDGRLEADNNTSENAIRPLATGRKNWLFAGSERGGRIAALYLGLIQSCKACQINPWEYFNDILRRVMSHPASQLRELLPDQWQPRYATRQAVSLARA